jgi:hypothetical protein
MKTNLLKEFLLGEMTYFEILASPSNVTKSHLALDEGVQELIRLKLMDVGDKHRWDVPYSEMKKNKEIWLEAISIYEKFQNQFAHV